MWYLVGLFLSCFRAWGFGREFDIYTPSNCIFLLSEYIGLQKLNPNVEGITNARGECQLLMWLVDPSLF